jgi:hypothetical protein
LACGEAGTPRLPRKAPARSVGVPRGYTRLRLSGCGSRIAIVKRPFLGPNPGFSLREVISPSPNVVEFLGRRPHRRRIWLCGAPWPWLAAAGGPRQLCGMQCFFRSPAPNIDLAGWGIRPGPLGAEDLLLSDGSECVGLAQGGRGS